MKAKHLYYIKEKEKLDGETYRLGSGREQGYQGAHCLALDLWVCRLQYALFNDIMVCSFCAKGYQHGQVLVQ